MVLNVWRTLEQTAYATTKRACTYSHDSSPLYNLSISLLRLILSQKDHAARVRIRARLKENKFVIGRSQLTATSLGHLEWTVVVAFARWRWFYRQR